MRDRTRTHATTNLAEKGAFPWFGLGDRRCGNVLVSERGRTTISRLRKAWFGDDRSLPYLRGSPDEARGGGAPYAPTGLGGCMGAAASARLPASGVGFGGAP